MIRAVLKNDAFLKDIKDAGRENSGFHLWWLGQSGFLLKWQNRHVLIDPYLSDSLTRKYARTDKQHIRMTELLIDPKRLNFIDLVTSSHNHTDHLDAETLRPLIKCNPGMQMVIPRANRKFAEERLNKSCDFILELNEGESILLNSGITIHGIPAAHNELEHDEQGNCKFMGYVFKFGDFCVYHSGDTLWREEIVNALRPFKIDLAILPINGNLPERRVAGNLNAVEAVELAGTIGADVLIPCHYHMFTFNTVEPDEFIQIATKNNQKIKVLQCGERFNYAKSGIQ